MSRTYRTSPTSRQLKLTSKGRALRDGSAARDSCAQDRALRHRRRQAAADPIIHGPLKPGQRESAPASLNHLIRDIQQAHAGPARDAPCSCGQLHCDYGLTQGARGRWQLTH